MAFELLKTTNTNRSHVRPWLGFLKRFHHDEFVSLSRSRRGIQRLFREVRSFESKLASKSESSIRSLAEDILAKGVKEGASRSLSVNWAGLIAETISRSHGFRLHDVQVQAMIAGAGGAIVEMQTGEGKTVVTGATAAMKLLTSQSVHVGTTNTYLAARDLEDMAATFELLGISYGLLPEESNESATRRAYRNQVVYGPGYQYGFDYLRDQMNLRKDRQSSLGVSLANRIRGRDPFQNLVQSGNHNVALIDEADSVMIDEAMTPLIISVPGSAHEDPTPYLLAKKITAEYVEGNEYTLKMPEKKLELTDKASEEAHDAVAKHRTLKLARPWRIYLTNAIRAKRLFTRNVDYVVVDEEVQIVDQYTGRILPDRTWQDGLHQAVEAKENVAIKPGRESTTQITRQRYLQMYDELAGLTGTAASVAKEFNAVYGCRVTEIPTNKPCIRKIDRTRFFADLDSKLEAIAVDVLRRHAKGQPVLVGTKTIEESLQIRDKLVAKGLAPTLLNGIQDEEEADIISCAGQFGAITIATNMAGRGTDIKPDAKALESGGLHVVGVSPNSSRRIDRQLVGRAARQGQPGSAQFFAAATDQLFEDNNRGLQKSIAKRARSNGESSDFTSELAKLQADIESRNFKQRQNMILRDRWMDTVREAIEKD
jgi:preprotein translocase subunit SecA